MTTYRQAADEGFKRLVTLWNGGKPFYASNGGCFWMGGNTFHVAIEYLSATHQPDTYGFAEDALTLFDKKITDPDPKNWVNDGTWVDDYGWWGIALTRAYIFAKTLGYDDTFKAKLAKYATNCWIGMNNSWDPSEIPNKNANVHISGGIWNSRTSDSYLAGRNCVTNEVYWLMSYLVSVEFGPQFTDPSTNSAVWFSQAKTDNVLFDGNGLVLERFDGTNGGVPGYSWLGDQGLFMFGCFRNRDPKASDLNVAQAEATAQAVSTNRTRDQVLSEELFSDSAFYLDYAGGKGIFIRNLATINDDHHNEPGTIYDGWIMANASAVWNNRLSNGNFHYRWDKQEDEPIDWNYPQDVVDNVLHASGLSALTACIPNMADKQVGTTAKSEPSAISV